MSNSSVLQRCPISAQYTWHPSLVNDSANVSSTIVVFVVCSMIPFVIFFNGVTLVVIAKYDALREERFVAVAFLSVADFFCGVVCQPLLVAKELYHLLNNQANCTIDGIFYIISSHFASVSLLQILCITYDRYVAITDPMHYKNRITIPRLICLSVASWVIVVVLGVVFGRLVPKDYTMVLVPLVIVLWSLIPYGYYKIFQEIKRLKRNSNFQHQCSGDQKHESARKYLRDRKSAITTMSIVGFVTLSYFPMIIDIFLGLYFGTNIAYPSFFIFHPWADACLFCSSLFDPLFYGVRSAEIRTKLIKLFGFQRMRNDIGVLRHGQQLRGLEIARAVQNTQYRSCEEVK